MKTHSIIFSLAVLLAHTSVQASAQCFSLFNPKNKLVYQSTEPLVDLSRSITDQIASLYPGHHLVVTPASYCPEVDERPAAQAQAKPLDGSRRTTYESPLLDLADEMGSTAEGNASVVGNGGGRTEPGKDVKVRTYQRSNGTIVRGHTRAAPGKGASGTRK